MSERKPKNIFVEGAITPAFIAACIGEHSHKTEIGGHSIFLGQVRADEARGGKVSAIEYSAYPEESLAN